MNTTLNIALIQSDLVWENPFKNREVFTQKIRSIKHDVDLIVLPEMFNTGFTMNAVEVAETMNGETLQWLTGLSKEKNCAIAGSMIIIEDQKYYNRLIFMFPDGTYTKYDKHQLFTLAKEQEVFTAGQDEVVVHYKNWNIKLQVCYDLRFPVWARNTSAYDILLYVASWPKLRINAWDVLLQARAIENMCYCIGVNRVGVDGKGYEYNGHSAIYDILGNSIIHKNPIETETIGYATLEKSHISEMREKLPFLNDADQFKLL